jgi:thiamine biosynthesis lipoprotein
MRAAFFLLILSFFSATMARADSEPGQICGRETIMTLPWTVCLVDAQKTQADLKAAIEESMNEVARIDAWMSEWKPKSLISQINQNAGIQPVHVTDEAFAAIEVSLKHSELTHGAFDISFNAFFGLYNWKKGHERFPTQAEINKLLPLVNYKNVILDPVSKTVFLKKRGMKIGLGGMGEGWAVDKVVALLKARKIQAGYVDASGAVTVWGKKPSGKLWSIGIGNPRPLSVAGGGGNGNGTDSSSTQKHKADIYKMYVTDVSVTTAGDTEKFFIKNGHRYHHIIDPKTGHSADKSIQVTAICRSSATLCDLVDDGVYILGPEEGIKYAESQGVAVMVIDPKEKAHFSKDLKTFESQWGPAVELR